MEENEGKCYDVIFRNEFVKYLGFLNEVLINVLINGLINGVLIFLGNGYVSGICCVIGVKKYYWKWVIDVELDEIMKK